MTTTTCGPLSMLTVAEAADELNISRRAMYQLCREGTVICRTVGAKGKTLHVLYQSLLAWAYGLPQPTQPEPAPVTPLQFRRQGERRVSR